MVGASVGTSSVGTGVSVGNGMGVLVGGASVGRSVGVLVGSGVLVGIGVLVLVGMGVFVLVAMGVIVSIGIEAAMLRLLMEGFVPQSTGVLRHFVTSVCKTAGSQALKKS